MHVFIDLYMALTIDFPTFKGALFRALDLRELLISCASRPLVGIKLDIWQNCRQLWGKDLGALVKWLHLDNNC